MRIRLVALTTIALATIMLAAGCNKGTTNSTNSVASNNAGGGTSASPGTTGTQPSPSSTATTSGSASTPTAAFRAYYEAVKSKDIETIKGLFSKATLNMMEERAKQTNMTLDAVMEKGLESASKDLPAEVPETRNEKIDGDKATLEIKDKDKWETLRFAREGGEWKIGFDEN
jgi:hypothetical protein